MVGLLGALAGTDVNTAAAAAGLHRIGDSLFQALLGALVYFFLWRHKAEPQATQIDSAVREAAERSPS
jgi:uncharacterized membrane protein YeaQ/YmgE (transglycosylase-associated protein family)